MEKANKIERVRVGSKPTSTYVAATLYALKNSHDSPFVIVEGLGRWAGKVLDVAQRTCEITDAHTSEAESFEVNGTPGVRVRVFKGGRG